MRRTELSQRGPKGYGGGCGIRIATLNIWSGRAGGLETALCALRQVNIGIGVLQETKLAGGIHIQQSLGYKVWDTEAYSRHQGWIAIVWRDAEGWGFEGVRNFGPTTEWS